MVLIQELESSSFATIDTSDSDDGRRNNDNETSDADDVVAAAVEALVKHYSQPIHVTTIDFRDDNDDALPPIVQLQLDRILSCSKNEIISSSTSRTTSMDRLLSAYRAQIRPAFLSPPRRRNDGVLLNIESAGVAVVVQYERLVSKYFVSSSYVEKDGVRTTTPATKSTILNETIEALACDLTTVQQQDYCDNTDDDTENSHISETISIVLVLQSCLLKLLHTALLLQAAAKNDSLDQRVARRCACTLLALMNPLPPSLSTTRGTSSSNRSFVEVMLGEDGEALLLDMSLYKYCCYNKPPENIDDSETANTAVNTDSLRLPRSVLEFVGMLNFASNDDDKIVGLATKACQALARAIRTGSNEDDDTFDDKNSCGENSNRLFVLLLEQLDPQEMARAVRAHFFGRDLLPDDELLRISSIQPKQQQQERLHLGRTVIHTDDPNNKDKEKVLMEKPYQVNPSRLRATLHFLSLLKSTEADVLDQVLPILYELLNGSSNDSICLGAASLYHLLKINDSDDSAASSQQQQQLLWTTGSFADNLFIILQQNIKTCRNGRTLALLGLAQRHLFLRLIQEQATNNSNNFVPNELLQRRRKATQQWLLILERHNLYTTKEDLVWGLLVGGIVPLLFDHAQQETTDPADALEVGRLGLAAILPVLRGECGYDNLGGGRADGSANVADSVLQGVDLDDLNKDDDETSSKDRAVMLSIAVQMAALTALSNLLIAAHPIMPRHAGKILCELFAFLRRHEWPKDDDNDIHEKPLNIRRRLLWNLKTLALEVASMSIVICGDPAVAILDRLTTVEEGSIQYDSELINLVKTVRDRASKLVAAFDGTN